MLTTLELVTIAGFGLLGAMVVLVIGTALYLFRLNHHHPYYDGAWWYGRFAAIILAIGCILPLTVILIRLIFNLD